MKKTFEQRVVDHQTGEVITTHSCYETSSNNGKFCFLSLDTYWYGDLKGSELQTLIALLSVENSVTHKIDITADIKTQLCANIELCVNQFEKNIRSLMKKDKLKRLSKGVYMVNPHHLWAGSNKTKTAKINTYDNY